MVSLVNNECPLLRLYNTIEQIQLAMLQACEELQFSELEYLFMQRNDNVRSLLEAKTIDNAPRIIEYLQQINQRDEVIKMLMRSQQAKLETTLANQAKLSDYFI